jgi:hypothetical protein
MASASVDDEALQLMTRMRDYVQQLETAKAQVRELKNKLQTFADTKLRDARDVLSKVYYGNTDLAPTLPYLLNTTPSDMCKRMFQHVDGRPLCTSAKITGAVDHKPVYASDAPAKHPLECIRLWIDASCDPNTSLYDMSRSTKEDMTLVRSKFFIPYTVCLACWVRASADTGFSFPVKTKTNKDKNPCLICRSKGTTSKERASGMCAGCCTEVVLPDNQIVLLAPAITILKSAYGLDARIGTVKCMDKFVDDVIEVGTRLFILIEKDTDGHPTYDADKEFERLKLVICDRLKIFEQVILIRYDQNGGDKKTAVALTSCLVRQWVLHAALRMTTKWAVVYLCYPSNNKHMARTLREFPDVHAVTKHGLPTDFRVVIADGPPTHNNNRAVYAMSTDEWEAINAAGIPPCESPFCP